MAVWHGPQHSAITWEQFLRYALAGGSKPYTHIGTTHRDMGLTALTVTDPFPIGILWQDLEVAPRI